nr:spore cortex biosynthesis protein YabQ [Orenia marismortui]
MIIIGLIIGVFFDFYRVLRGNLNLKRIITDIFDLLFCLFTMLIIFLTLIYSNDGLIRIYIFLGVILGQIIYYYFLSNFIILFFSKVLVLIYSCYNKIKGIIVWSYKKLKILVFRSKKWIISIFKG